MNTTHNGVCPDCKMAFEEDSNTREMNWCDCKYLESLELNIKSYEKLCKDEEKYFELWQADKKYLKGLKDKRTQTIKRIKERKNETSNKN